MENNITKPADLAKKSIDDLFNELKNVLQKIEFMNEQYVKDIDISSYNIPRTNMFFHKMWNKTFVVKRHKNPNELSFILVANFIVIGVKECIHIYNNRSGKPPLKYFLITIKNHNEKIEKDVKVANNSKSDFRQFQEDINSLYNDFIVNMQESIFKSFVAKYISPNVASTVKIYSNSGVLDDRVILYENALATTNGIIRADEDKYIKIKENTYIRAEEGTHNLPNLFKSEKSGKQIANELMSNIKECWADDIVSPLLTLGSMVMAIYYNDFAKRYGVPTLILYGETGTGKSTLVTVGLSIFGLSKDAMTSGGSTPKSNEFFCSKYNCMNICIDDVKGETLTSSSFTTLIKGAYKGIPRTRMLPYGKNVEYIHTCSPLSYSTNEALPELKEVINRINIIEIFGKAFQADKFNYHEINKNNPDNLRELSLILPEFLKYSTNDVIKIYEDVFKILESNVEDTQKRVISNIAYAYTGALMLSFISGVEFENLNEQVIQYAKKRIKNYEDIETPVDKVLSLIATLHELKQLENGVHFRIVGNDKTGNGEYHIRFNKKVVLSVINKFYAHDKSNNVNERVFNCYAQNHSRYRGNIAVRYNNGKSTGDMSVCFNITDMPEYYQLITGNTL